VQGAATGQPERLGIPEEAQGWVSGPEEARPSVSMLLGCLPCTEDLACEQAGQRARPEMIVGLLDYVLEPRPCGIRDTHGEPRDRTREGCHVPFGSTGPRQPMSLRQPHADPRKERSSRGRSCTAAVVARPLGQPLSIIKRGSHQSVAPECALGGT